MNRQGSVVLVCIVVPIGRWGSVKQEGKINGGIYLLARWQHPSLSQESWWKTPKFLKVKLPPQSFLFPIKLMFDINTVAQCSIQYHLVSSLVSNFHCSS